MVKDILRELKARKLQFLAIFLITTLGVGFFIGIRVTGYDMRLTADAYMEEANVLDLKVMHSLGIDKEMREEIDEIVDAKGYRLRSKDVYAESNKFDDVINLYEFTEATKNDLTVLDGRLPANKKEAVVDTLLRDVYDIELFDEIKIKKNDIFEEDSLTIVGFGQSSLYLNKSRGNTNLGSGEIKGFVYAKGLEAKLDEVVELRYTFADDRDIEKIEKKLEDKSEEISKARYQRATASELEKLDEAEAELEEVKKEKEAELAKEQAKLDAARADLKVAKRRLEAGMNELTFGFTVSTTDPLSARLALIKQNYNAAVALQEQTIKRLEEELGGSGENPLEDSQVLQELEAELEAMTAQFTEGFAQLEAGVAEYNRGLAEVRAGQEELDAGRAELEKEIKENKEKIADARKQIKEASTGELYIFDRKDSIIGYKEFYDDSERIEAIGAVFPLIFFGVALLVTLSTITRMIEESRMQLGVYKALGYTSFQASLKYVGFAGLAWFIGSVLGVAIGFYLLPNLIYNAYSILYETPPLKSSIVFSYMYIPIIVSFLSSVGVAFYKSMRTSSEKGAQLLRPPLPKSGQRIFLEKVKPIWNRLSFLYKVSFRNLFRNKSRFLMTVIGIGGCAGLLITGFGLDHSVNSMIDIQFNEIINYDGLVVYENDAQLDETVYDDFTDLRTFNTNIEEDNVTLYVAEDFFKFPEFFTLRHPSDNQDIEVETDMVVLTQKVAEVNDLSVGDSFELELDGEKYSLELGAIAENYAENYLFMSEENFEDSFNRSVDMNMRFFKKADIEDGFAEEILENDKVLNVTLADNILNTLEDQMGNFNVIIYVVVIAAFLLELIVLTNLITMNISERKKELATLKVLGFYPNELSKYILRENIILTFIALLLGGVFGVFLHYFVIITAELDAMMFNRELNVFSVVISLVLTLLISIVINFIMSRKANDVDMSEALKTFDA